MSASALQPQRRGNRFVWVFLSAIFLTAGCARPPGENADPPGLPRIEMNSRSAAVKAVYAKRVDALVADPTSITARGALAVFLHANDFLAEAAALYEELWQTDQKEPRWPYYLSRIRQDEGQIERARVLLDEAAARAPGHALIELRRADLLLKSGEQDAAESGYRSYLARVPGSAHGRLGLARIAMQKQDWNGAEALLVEALKEEPDFQAGRMLLVSVYETLGLAAKAARARQTVVTIRRHREPDDPWLDELVDHCFDVEKLSVLADIAIESGRIKRGLELLEHSREIEPTRGRTHLELAKAKLQTEGRAAALPLLTTAIRLEPALAEAHHLLAGELHASGDLRGALSAAESGLRHSPGHAGLHRQHGALLQVAGRLADAEQALRRAVSLDPGDVKNVETLGNFHWAAGQKEEAVAEFERARALSRLAVKPRAILAAYYLEAEKLPQAERCLAEAFEIEPGMDGLDELRATLQVRRGNAYFRAGDVVHAEGAYRLALAAMPDHEESVTNLVAVWLRTGRIDEARDLLTTFMAENPNVVFAYSLAARVAAQSGDRKTALELVTRGLELARAQRDSRQEQALQSLRERLRAR